MRSIAVSACTVGCLLLSVHPAISRASAPAKSLADTSGVVVTIAPTSQSIFNSKQMWHLDGYKVKEYKGIAMGVEVRTLGLGRAFGVMGKSLLGGHLESVRKLMDQTRREAYDRMVADARKQGANAVLWARFEDRPCGNYTEIIWYGNAVVIEPDNSSTSAPAL